MCILALTSLPLMLIGWAWRDTLYAEYEFSPLKEPGLALVLEGVHDGVYPWQGLFGAGKKTEEDTSEADAAQTGETAGQVSDAADGKTDGGQKTEQKPGEQQEVKPDGNTSVTEQDKAAQEAEKPAAGSEQPAQDSEKTAAGSEQPAEETGQEPEKTEDPAVEKLETLPQNAIHADSDTIPEGVCNPVMMAEDYDVVNVAFLSPDDTEYNTDTEGIFAKNGIYYKLGPVDSTYFSDALFIGDSRTVGLCEYGSLKENAAFLAKESVNVYNVLDQELRFTDHDGETWDAYVEEILEENTYGKVYLALGVNELGIGTTYMYYEKYREIVELIRETQPDALIYIQGIMHVSYKKSSSDSCRNNTVISQRNYAISTLANGRDIFYIDMNPYVCDENGDLFEDLSGDGIHLKASAYENWDRSLMENAIVIIK